MTQANATLTVVEPTAETSGTDEFGYQRVLQSQRLAFERDRYPSIRTRLENLQALKAVLHQNREKIIDALHSDFGHRSRDETCVAEIAATVGHIEFASKKLGAWMRPRHRSTSKWFLPGSNSLQAQPLGVIGIVAPWNYPINLALAPLIAALAAGNRAMIKMSEYTPAATALLQEILAENFAEDHVAVFGGESKAASAFCSLPFDHLLFTGSGNVGRQVMLAAAKNLTPVTLELGGKSPVIIDKDYPIDEAARRILWGKIFNSGQTCVAPDYLLIPKGTTEEFVIQFARAFAEFFPDGAASDDYTSVIDDRNHSRLLGLIETAKEAGAGIVPLEEQSDSLKADRKLPPVLILNPPTDSRVMRDEIFGPLLPVIEVDDIEAAINRVNDGDRPLALYYFGHSERNRDRVLKHTHAGGVTVNDVMLQFLQVSMPFGGVGGSGMGSYHGQDGFDTFSHIKPTFQQRGVGRFTGLKLLYPPYGRMGRKLIKEMGG